MAMAAIAITATPPTTLPAMTGALFGFEAGTAEEVGSRSGLEVGVVVGGVVIEGVVVAARKAGLSTKV